MKDIAMAIAIVLYKENNFQKWKVNSKDKYYNCYQKGYYNWDCQFPDKKKKVNIPWQYEN